MTPPNPVFALVGQGAATLTKNVRLDSPCKGIKIFVNLKAGSTGTLPTVVVAAANIVPDGQPVASQNVGPALLTSAALAAGTPGVTELTIYPGVLAVANVIANNCVGQDVQISVTIGGTAPAVNAEISVQPLW